MAAAGLPVEGVWKPDGETGDPCPGKLSSLGNPSRAGAPASEAPCAEGRRWEAEGANPSASLGCNMFRPGWVDPLSGSIANISLASWVRKASSGRAGAKEAAL